MDHFSKSYTHASSSNSPNKPSVGSGSIRSRRPPSFSSRSASDAPSTEQYPGGMLACALGVSVFFSRVSGSRLLCIERLCTADPGSGLQSAVEWGTHIGGWGHALGKPTYSIPLFFFSNSGCSVAIGQTKGGLSVWDASTKQQITRLRPSTLTPASYPSFDNANTPEPSQVCAMSWNRNLLAAGLNGSALLWDLRAPAQRNETEGAACRLMGHGTHKVCGVRWREDGEMLATGGDDNMVCVWDVRMPRRPVVSSTNPDVDNVPNAGGGNNATSADAAPPVERTPMWRKRRHTGAVKVSSAHISTFIYSKSCNTSESVLICSCLTGSCLVSLGSEHSRIRRGETRRYRLLLERPNRNAERNARTRLTNNEHILLPRLPRVCHHPRLSCHLIPGYSKRCSRSCAISNVRSP